MSLSKRRAPIKISTRIARYAIAGLVEHNVEKLSAWLDEIYQKDGPAVAWDKFIAVLEYHVPKLARVEANATWEHIVRLPQEQTDAIIERARKVSGGFGRLRIVPPVDDA